MEPKFVLNVDVALNVLSALMDRVIQLITVKADPEAFTTLMVLRARNKWIFKACLTGPIEVVSECGNAAVCGLEGFEGLQFVTVGTYLIWMIEDSVITHLDIFFGLRTPTYNFFNPCGWFFSTTFTVKGFHQSFSGNIRSR
jgi:hypothetical protein